MSKHSSLEQRLAEKGVQMTKARKAIARALDASDDHPDVTTLCQRASVLESSVSVPTVYRALKLFEELGLLEKHTFGRSHARYETATKEQHDHLVDLETDEVIEFSDPDIEALKHKIAKKLGYQLVGHRLELYGMSLKSQRSLQEKKSS